MKVLLLVYLLLQWLSLVTAYCQSLVQDCGSDESDNLADFQEMFVQYQQKCDVKEYFQILSVKNASRIYNCRYSILYAWLM